MSSFLIGIVFSQKSSQEDNTPLSFYTKYLMPTRPIFSGMKPIAQNLGKVIRNAILKIAPPAGDERPSTKQIYQALKAARPVLSKEFGNPAKCRYAGCPPVTGYKYCKRPLRVLEYLWDFSFSRFDIPRAIEQCGKVPAGSMERQFTLVYQLFINWLTIEVNKLKKKQFL